MSSHQANDPAQPYWIDLTRLRLGGGGRTGTGGLKGGGARRGGAGGGEGASIQNAIPESASPPFLIPPRKLYTVPRDRNTVPMVAPPKGPMRRPVLVRKVKELSPSLEKVPFTPTICSPGANEIDVRVPARVVASPAGAPRIPAIGLPVSPWSVARTFPYATCPHVAPL